MSYHDPSFMTPEERLYEIARVFADGVLRLHARSALSGGGSASNAGAESSGSETPPRHSDHFAPAQ